MSVDGVWEMEKIRLVAIGLSFIKVGNTRIYPVWGRMAVLVVGYDFGLGHAEIEVPLRYCSGTVSRQHTQSHSVPWQGLQVCPVLPGCSHGLQPPGMAVVSRDFFHVQC